MEKLQEPGETGNENARKRWVLQAFKHFDVGLGGDRGK
jgi:hypothetical protein